VKFELIVGHYSNPRYFQFEGPSNRSALLRLEDLADEYASEHKWEYVDYLDELDEEEAEEEAFNEAMGQGTFCIRNLSTGEEFDLSYPFYPNDFSS
jgi:hypothetical protein